MSKAAKAARNVKKAVEKINHGNKISTNIPAGSAAAGPPLGPTLGQHGINIAAFCKDFNERTSEMKEGIPLPTRITVNPDRSYVLVINKPPTSYFLKQAAGIQRGAMAPGNEICGKITRKHVYEISKIKSQDPSMALLDLQAICKKTIGVAHSVGIEIVDGDLDPNEYQEFLVERAKIVEEQKKALQDAKDAKMLRTG